MKPLHTSAWCTESDSRMVVRVGELSTPDGPVRRIVVEANAEMDTTEARRLIADVQHAVALAEEQPAASDLTSSTDGRKHVMSFDCWCNPTAVGDGRFKHHGDTSAGWLTEREAWLSASVETVHADDCPGCEASEVKS